MIANKYQLDSAVLLSVQFTNADDGSPADPTTTTLMVKDPTGTETTYTFGVDPGVVQDSVGAYHMELTASISGVWIYKWRGIGSVVQTTPDTYFRVEASEVLSG